MPLPHFVLPLQRFILPDSHSYVGLLHFVLLRLLFRMPFFYFGNINSTFPLSTVISVLFNHQYGKYTLSIIILVAKNNNLFLYAKHFNKKSYQQAILNRIRNKKFAKPE